MTHVGIFPAVGSGLGSMAATGQLERLYVHLSAYTDRGALTYHTYGDYADERHLWERFYRQTGANLVAAGPDDGLRGALLWPWRDARRFKTLDVCRVMSLRGAPPVLMAYWLWRVPFVVSLGNDYPGINRLHGRSTWKIRWLERCIARWAAAIFVNNKARADRMRRTNPRVHHVPSWVDLDRFRPDVPRALARNRQRRRLLYVGRLVVEKNLIPVAQVARAADLEFVCLGAGPEEDALRRAGAACLGVVPWEELPGWYTSADAFILPSFLEGHPKALLEALACGVPSFLSTTLDGCRDLPGARFSPDDMPALARAFRSASWASSCRPSLQTVAPFARELVLPREVALVEQLCQSATRCA